MIATLTGRLRRKASDYLIVDVSGVGYQVYVPLSTYYGIPDEHEEINLHIHTHLREDSLSLFGFLTQEEKDMFLLLLGVSGIGPKLALAVLSSLSVHDLSCALQDPDGSKLCAIPGIGKKTAARMVLELKDKAKLLAPSAAPAPAASEDADLEDAVSALMRLGYKKPLAEEALKKVRYAGAAWGPERLIKEALGLLMKR
jgi:holliday junction DNA helicase RuvA